ncbi:Protoporphyrin IX Mg-chelatase subunit H [Rhodovulum sp. P5]|uniref:magnesium chelatase subunit H n=1 Tax=Rhodovulum sp. P5 TaxID=1564506 RepID=UPI0009C1CC7E|nr:magnesium chelatase subunit H [Rhodovulum sp. P5]ARE40125.1 Protoporphyrin IX Mg-chelatase subunit H [Rhodovulum sp. P5]
MRDDRHIPGYRVVIVTLDSHSAGPAERVTERLKNDFPGLMVSVHAAATWSENPDALALAKDDVLNGDIILVNLLFIEEHINAILPELQQRRDHCDAMIGIIADKQIVTLTRMGDLDMMKPASGPMKLLKKLRGSSDDKGPKKTGGEKQMAMLRRLPKMLKYVPGKAQDLRAWFMTMQYWLGGSDDNVEQMVRFLVSRYAHEEAWRGTKSEAPVEYPEVGLYHPDIPHGITTDIEVLPRPENPVATVGIVMMRSYILASDTAHYDAVIRALEERGIRVIAAFAGGLDARPAIDAYFKGEDSVHIDTLVSLTGFSLIGGPAYNDSEAAVEVLSELDVPYIAAHPLEFQTLGQWSDSSGGLGPVETTMLIALPELDGAISPTVFGGRHGPQGCTGCGRDCSNKGESKQMDACSERVDALSAKVDRLARLRRSQVADRKVGVILFGFPPNAGAVGTAAYLSVFESLFNTLHRMKAEGYQTGDLPASVEELRTAILEGNAKQYGQEANVCAHVSADDIVRGTPWLSEIEEVWGPAPGKVRSDGRGVFVLGVEFGNVFVGVQPTFGYEGDPMRLLFERGFAPTHAFSTFYLWLKNMFRADVLLHFGMHGALEFMPGKQAGMGARDWPDRLIGDMPNVYLYASNNPSEATLAKRRSNAVTITHLTPPLASSGLYKGLQELKDSLTRWRKTEPGSPEQADLEELIKMQAEAVDMGGTPPEKLWLKLLETEDALIPDGLHVVGRPVTDDERKEHLRVMCDVDDETRDRVDHWLQQDTELPAILRALGGRYIQPVPGGDLIRSAEVLPTGRNIHAFDPFRMPTQFAMNEGAKQAQKLLDAHDSLPRSVAMVLWGSDNIKSDGGPIAQAMALMGAKPRFDSYGRLSGADLVPLEDLGRPRIDVVMTLSGIFRDLLPLQTRMLAEAAWKAAMAEDEPLEMNFIRAHSLAHAEKMGVDMECAALRVFSNAEGAYGSNVNGLVDSGAWGDEDELADAYEARKSFAYGRDGKSKANAALLQQTLKDVDVAYQNLESVELGVTTVDHYFDTLGGISRAVKRARGGKDAAVYIGDTTRGEGKVRTLKEQVDLETRSRSLNPKWFEGMLKHGHEGVRQIEAQVTNTLGWSATTGQVEPWVYQRLSETFVLDEEMRKRLASLNPAASAKMANRLLEAHDRNYWQPDAETLAALQAAADELEDRLEGIAAE